MRRIPIRMKLAAALAVPLIGLFFITAVEVAETASDVDDVRAQTALARASVGPSGVITGIQNERTWAVVELIGQENAIQPPVVGYEESRAITDDAIASFRETLQSGSETAAQAYAPSLENLDDLGELRDMIDANTRPRDLANVAAANDVYQDYLALIRPFLDANSRVALAIDDAELRQATSLVDTTTRQLEVLSELARTSILEITVGGGLDSSTEIATIARLRSTFDAGNRRLVEAPAPFDAVVGPEYPSDLVDGFTGELDKALTGEPPDMASLLSTLNVPADGGYMGVRNALVQSLNDRADELNAAAERRERIYVVMAVLTLVIAIGLTWIVSRSITRPLRALTRQAKDMADNRLPDAVTDILETPLGENITVPQVDPVRIRTRDEVSDVADALNTVQDTALDLAVEQAVLRRNIADSFVNLGRRNQNLLGRQLDFITELETNETNADALSNLFRLDHLATRMRRNAESLLVLAGIEPPRQWAAPVRLTDVIRAALGEVENYQRVAVRGVEPATIIGSAAADLAHLLAELVENALVFSPPDQSVDIRGRNREDGGYTLAVIDTGLGMAAKDVTAANRRLAGAESFTVAPSKYLGHYVAGNLAARHDINVRLDTSPGQGITATLTLPPTLLTTDQVTSAPVTPPHGQRPVRVPPAPEPPAALPAAPAAAPWGAPPAPVPSPPPAGSWDAPPPQPQTPAARGGGTVERGAPELGPGPRGSGARVPAAAVGAHPHARGVGAVRAAASRARGSLRPPGPADRPAGSGHGNRTTPAARGSSAAPARHPAARPAPCPPPRAAWPGEHPARRGRRPRRPSTTRRCCRPWAVTRRRPRPHPPGRRSPACRRVRPSRRGLRWPLARRSSSAGRRRSPRPTRSPGVCRGPSSRRRR